MHGPRPRGESALQLPPATPGDEAYLLRLEETCMRGYAEALWGCWNPADTPDTLDVAGHFLIVREGVVVGCVAEVWEEGDLFIDSLYVDAPFQRRGIGAEVLRAKVAEAATKGLPVKLSVLTTNDAALRFYQRQGFAIVAETAERRLMSTAGPADRRSR